MCPESRRRSLIFPALLIVAGIVFLMYNLGLLDSNLWNTLLSLWPALLIVLGLDSLFRRHGLVGPVFLIVLGGLFLLSNFGGLAVDVWWTILRLWPIVLIAIGLDILLGRRSIAFSLLGLLLVLAILGVGLWSSGLFLATGVGQPLEGVNILQPLDSATQAKITLSPSVASLYLDDKAGKENLIEGIVRTWPQDNILQNTSRDDGSVSFSLESKAKNVPFGICDNNRYVCRWDLSLNADIPLELTVNLGVGQSSLDLSGLTLISLTQKTGVGETKLTLPSGEYRADISGGVGKITIILPDEGHIRLKIEGGVGEIVIQIPKDMAASIQIDKGLSGLTLPPGYQKQDEVYLSPGFNTATDFAEITIDQGIGNISIQEK
ncbi:MAG: DUF5668 domain-containing protein [Chloroflexota bacterium]